MMRRTTRSVRVIIKRKLRRDVSYMIAFVCALARFGNCVTTATMCIWHNSREIYLTHKI